VWLGLLPGISMASLPSTKNLLALPKRFLDLPKASLSLDHSRGVHRDGWRLPLGGGDVQRCAEQNRIEVKTAG
jgi:hypothetical protein